mmetsp:Transcript_29164/g.56277  ORF Transcript_29164/g.56277 Transcript_29164/m.56277 type:complete len:411 (+) Transcript_29164:141-1373(+)
MRSVVVGALRLDLAPAGHVAIVLVQRLGKRVTTSAIRHKEDIGRAIGLPRRHQAGAPRIGNWRRRQPFDDIGVPRCRRAQFRPAQAPAQHPLPPRDAIDHRRVRLQPHAPVQPVDKDRRHLPPLIGHGGLLLDDRGQGQQLFRAVQRQIPIPRFPRSRDPQFLLLHHTGQHVGARVAHTHLVTVWGQRPLRRDFLYSALQHIHTAQRRHHLPACDAFGQRNAVARVLRRAHFRIKGRHLIRARLIRRPLNKSVGGGVQLADLSTHPVHTNAVDHLGATGARPAARDNVDDLFHRGTGLHQIAARLQLARLARIIGTHPKQRSAAHSALRFQITAHTAKVRAAVNLHTNRLGQRPRTLILAPPPQDDAPRKEQRHHKKCHRIRRDGPPHQPTFPKITLALVPPKPKLLDRA